VHSNLGVGVAAELLAGGLELTAQRGVVLDDAVVDDGDLAVGIAVRMGIAVGGPAVGGPAGVTETGLTGQDVGIRALEDLTEVGQAARLAVHAHPAAAVQQRDAGRVIAAIFHPVQCIDHDAAGRTLPYVADDSAHEDPG
jgi:hypothetical protein